MSEESSPGYELFHAIDDDGASAAARAAVARLALLERFRFRNVFYPEVRADLAARGGAVTPAVWDGATLVSGKDAVLALLETIAASR